MNETGQFRRDHKREAKGRHHTILDTELVAVLFALASDHHLEPRHHDHALHGEWKGFRDCHLRPDLLLIYQKPDADTLRLVRLGSHSELGLGFSSLRSPRVLGELDDVDRGRSAQALRTRAQATSAGIADLQRATNPG